MAASSSQRQATEPFPPDVCFRYKLLRVLETAGQKVLVYTLHCGTPAKSTSVPLHQYLDNLPQASTAPFLTLTNQAKKKHFNKTDMNTIRANASCDTFDITLLHKAITVACEEWKGGDDADKLVKRIKDMRNEVIHEVCKKIDDHYFLTKVKDIEETCLKGLEAVVVKYNTDRAECDNLKDNVKKIIRDIQHVKISEEEILKASVSTLVPLFKTEADKELQHHLEQAQFIDPLSFLSGQENIKVNVKDVFMKITILEEQNTKRRYIRNDNTLHPLKLLSHTQSGCQPSSPHLILVEGDAGSGKTTLLKYLISEYLKEESDRRMEGLHRYDLLMWVVCREETSNTLESLLKRLLPEAYTKYGNLVMPLLKKIHVIILIDGLDEQDGSRYLVKDILSQGKDCPTFTLVATSRPEAIQTMKADTPTNFMMSHLQLDGVFPDDRKELALRHYRCLSAKDDTRLRKVMEQIGWKAMFRLPLNVVFLAKLLAEESEDIAVCESELYQQILDWCLEKLKGRLLRQVSSTTLLDANIDKVFRECCKVSYLALIQGKIYLSDDLVSEVVGLCHTYELPETEILAAFYSLRREVVAGRTKTRYHAPHKGLQDFMAARHITESLHKYKEGDILRMLQRSKLGEQAQVSLLRNMFRHLLGLLSQKGKAMTKAVQETVGLIKQSGVSDVEDWLNLLADTNVNKQILKTVAQQTSSSTHGRLRKLQKVVHLFKRSSEGKEEEEEAVTVTDGTVDIATALLPLIKTTKRITLELYRDTREIEPFFMALGHHKTVAISLEHHYRRPRSGVYSDHWLRLAPKSDLEFFVGHLNAEHLSLLPRGMAWLSVSVASGDNAESFIPSLASLRENFPQLEALSVHLTLSTITSPPSTSLPGGVVPGGVELYLSDMSDEDLDLACDIASALSPSNGEGYLRLYFPRAASLRVDGWRHLIGSLASRKVRVQWCVFVPRLTLTEDEEKQLETLTQSLLGCRLVWFDFSDWQ